jgi:electron transfer flavoprotein alpha subunit
VAPDVYLALGVRGSFNHLVGLRRAKMVIAVNKDPEAEFFADADLGIVGDAASFAAGLLQALDDPTVA